MNNTTKNGTGPGPETRAALDPLVKGPGTVSPRYKCEKMKIVMTSHKICDKRRSPATFTRGGEVHEECKGCPGPILIERVKAENPKTAPIFIHSVNDIPKPAEFPRANNNGTGPGPGGTVPPPAVIKCKADGCNATISGNGKTGLCPKCAVARNRKKITPESKQGKIEKIKATCARKRKAKLEAELEKESQEKENNNGAVPGGTVPPPDETKCKSCGSPIKQTGKTGLCKKCAVVKNLKKARTPEMQKKRIEGIKAAGAHKRKAKLEAKLEKLKRENGSGTVPEEKGVKVVSQSPVSLELFPAGVIQLDFSDYPKLLNALRAAAKEDFRSLEQQALHLIALGLKTFSTQIVKRAVKEAGVTLTKEEYQKTVEIVNKHLEERSCAK